MLVSLGRSARVSRGAPFMPTGMHPHKPLKSCATSSSATCQLRKRIAAALAGAAAAAGLAPSQLVERTVPDGGLDAAGTVAFTVGAVTARASVDDQLKVATRWLAAGLPGRQPARRRR